MYFEANGFMNAYSIKKQQMRTYLGKELNEIPKPCCIVLLSFACELYLKVLFCLEKIEEDSSTESITMEKGHNLDELFNRLGHELKQAIADDTECTIEGLTTELRNHKDDFIKWRYIFESNLDEFAYNVDFLEKVVNSLYKKSKIKVNKVGFNATDISYSISGTDNYCE